MRYWPSIIQWHWFNLYMMIDHTMIHSYMIHTPHPTFNHITPWYTVIWYIPLTQPSIISHHDTQLYDTYPSPNLQSYHTMIHSYMIHTPHPTFNHITPWYTAIWYIPLTQPSIISHHDTQLYDTYPSPNLQSYHTMIHSYMIHTPHPTFNHITPWYTVIWYIPLTQPSIISHHDTQLYDTYPSPNLQSYHTRIHSYMIHTPHPTFSHITPWYTVIWYIPLTQPSIISHHDTQLYDTYPSPNLQSYHTMIHSYMIHTPHPTFNHITPWYTVIWYIPLTQPSIISHHDTQLYDTYPSPNLQSYHTMIHSYMIHTPHPTFNHITPWYTVIWYIPLTQPSIISHHDTQLYDTYPSPNLQSYHTMIHSYMIHTPHPTFNHITPWYTVIWYIHPT